MNEKKTVGDCFWIWGHDAGAHHIPECKAYHIPGENKMGPWEGAEYLGIPNCCRVVFNGSPEPPFDRESEKLRHFRKVVWSVMGDASSKRNDDGGDDLDEVLKQAAVYPNVVGGVLDDFFRPQQKNARMSPEKIRQVADRLHQFPRPLQLWVVYYAALLDIDYSPWLDPVDVITFWAWNSQQLAQAGENLDRIIRMTPDKQHYAGCYIYNYGDCRPMTLEEMKFQLDLYYRLLREHRIQGVIVCSNTVADVGLDAPEYLRKWLQKHGEESI